MTGTTAAVASEVDFDRYGAYTVKRTAPADGNFQRPVYPFTGRVTAGGASGYRAEPGRYHLYVSLACPWAQAARQWWALRPGQIHAEPGGSVQAEP